MSRLWVDGWWSTDKQHGPKTSIFFVGPGPSSWAVLVGRTGPFSTVLEDFLPIRFALVVVSPSRGALGGWDRVHTGPCPLLYTYFRVSEPVLASIQMIQTLRQGPGGSQHEVAHPDRVDTKLQAWGQPCIIPSSLSHARNCNYLLTVNGTCRAAARFCRRAVAAGIPSRYL